MFKHLLIRRINTVFHIKLQNAIIDIAQGTKIPFLLNMCVPLLQSCLTLCNPMDLCLSDSSVYGILQAGIVEWVAMSSSSGLFLTQGSNPHLFCLLHWQAVSLPVVLPGKPFLWLRSKYNNLNYFIYEWYLSNIVRMVKNIEIFLYNEQQSREFLS